MSKENTEEKDIKTSTHKEAQDKTQDKTKSSTKKTSADHEPEEEKKVKEDGLEKEETDPVVKLQDELSEAKDKYLRLYSEYDNYRRRTARERLDLLQTANEDLILSLLPVLDDFERAESSFSDETNIQAVREGVHLISQKFVNTLQQKGLKQMDTKEGVEFNADLHEAITQIPAPKKKLKGKIVDTVQKGYYLGEKVIRHARVVVGK